MLLFAALISGSFSLGHLAVPFIDPWALNAIRFIFATMIMGTIGFTLSRRIPIVKEKPFRFIVLGALPAAYFVAMFIALQTATPVSTGAIFTLIPLMSAGFGWLFMRQTTGIYVLTSLVTAAAGAIWVIFRGDVAAIQAFEIGKGEAIFFVGCIAYAAYAPLVRKFNNGEQVLPFTFTALFASTIYIVIFGTQEILMTNWGDLPMVVWLAIAYLAIFTTVGTFFLVQFASMRLPASKVFSYGYLTPAFVILYEGLLGHGWVSAGIMTGALITAASLLFMAFASDY